MGMKTVVFLDRDGVINKKPPELDYVKSWEEFEWLPKAKEAIKRLNEAGFLVIVVTNQRGVARGLMSKKDVEEIHRRMQQELSKLGAKIDAFYYCPHNIGDNCSCRKPKPGLINKSQADFSLPPGGVMIGDSRCDLDLAKTASLTPILISDNKFPRSLWEAADFILGKER